jgi:hypothetical protein
MPFVSQDVPRDAGCRGLMIAMSTKAELGRILQDILALFLDNCDVMLDMTRTAATQCPQ